MNLKLKYAMQAGGMCHLWQSPDGRFRHSFLKLDFECEPDCHAGIVILADENYQNARAFAVQDLRREFPELLKPIQGKPVAYWWLEEDKDKLKNILAGITTNPDFADSR